MSKSATPWTAAHQASLSITSFGHLLKPMSIESDAIQPSHSLLSPSPPAFNLSNIRVFSNESVLRIRWPKYWSFSFSISPSNEHPGLISFRTDWFDLLAVFANTTVQKHQLFGAQLSLWSNSHPYMTTGKMIALTRWTFVNKIMSLLFNVLPRFVIAFLPRSKRFIISWLRSPSAVISLVTH